MILPVKASEPRESPGDICPLFARMVLRRSNVPLPVMMPPALLERVVLLARYTVLPELMLIKPELLCVSPL